MKKRNFREIVGVDGYERLVGTGGELLIVVNPEDADDDTKAELKALDDAIKNCKIKLIDGAMSRLESEGAVFWSDDGGKKTALNNDDRLFYDAYITIALSEYSACSLEQFAYIEELLKVQKAAKRLGFKSDDYGHVYATQDMLEHAIRIASGLEPYTED